MSLSKLLRLVYRHKPQYLHKNRRYNQNSMIMVTRRCYEGKPFDQKDKNWADQQDQNMDYDIDQNIYDFRRKEEMKMKDKHYQDRAKAKYDKHRSRMAHEFQVHEQWRELHQERRKQQNWQNFSFTASVDDIPKNDSNSMNNAAKYGMFGIIGVAGIGFLLIKSS